MSSIQTPPYMPPLNKEAFISKHENQEESAGSPHQNTLLKVGIILTGILAASWGVHTMYKTYEGPKMPQNFSDLTHTELNQLKISLQNVCQTSVERFCKTTGNVTFCIKNSLDPAWKAAVLLEHGTDIVCPIQLKNDIYDNIVDYPSNPGKNRLNLIKERERIEADIPKDLPIRLIKALRSHQEANKLPNTKIAVTSHVHPGKPAPQTDFLTRAKDLAMQAGRLVRQGTVYVITNGRNSNKIAFNIQMMPDAPPPSFWERFFSQDEETNREIMK